MIETLTIRHLVGRHDLRYSVFGCLGTFRIERRYAIGRFERAYNAIVALGAQPAGSRRIRLFRDQVLDAYAFVVECPMEMDPE